MKTTTRRPRASRALCALLLLSPAAGRADVSEDALPLLRIAEFRATIHGDWHEDRANSTEDRMVFVPQRVDLGPSRYRNTLHFGRDGSFSTLRLHPADAHYLCRGTFATLTERTLRAQCYDPLTRKTLVFDIQILETTEDRLVVRISTRE
ncbi:hypothetical protein [Polyangium jinanense]|uniref:DUF306 domain-containing protein n=1 Tax=Polyangium jinanense TaxID=2829994 RepID=A0A9X4ARD6_9BACT|nr:hypothetical protein [Polyangium jinanense]MDC3982013.1 hypothetical protein [Polyangium jinanense]